MRVNSRIERIRENWQRRGFSCDLWTDRPGARWEGYVHKVDELFMVLDGDIELEIEGDIHRPAPYLEVLIPARAKHSVRNLGENESHWLSGYMS